jgi:transcriptional regulator with XRE-family HTH domain
MRQKRIKSSNQHWTARKTSNFLYFVAADFVDQMRSIAESRGMKQKAFAKKLGLSEGRISQVFNNPGNLTLNTMVDWSRALGVKASIVVYDDHDSKNKSAPLSGSIFNECWRRIGSPLHWPGSDQPYIPSYQICNVKKLHLAHNSDVSAYSSVAKNWEKKGVGESGGLNGQSCSA